MAKEKITRTIGEENCKGLRGESNPTEESTKKVEKGYHHENRVETSTHRGAI